MIIVNTTDDWCGDPRRVGDSEGVRVAVSNGDAVSGHRGAGDPRRRRQNHRVEIYPQLANTAAHRAEGVQARICVSAGGVAVDDGVGVVGTGAPTTADREDAADSE